MEYGIVYLLTNPYMPGLVKIGMTKQEKTSKWLAGQVGKSACTVSKLCNNVEQPDLNTLDKITKLLDIDVKDLLNITEK